MTHAACRRALNGVDVPTLFATLAAVKSAPEIADFVPVLDDGDIRHRNGSTTSPGLHVIGMRWQTRRSSTFLDGVRRDAAIVVAKVLKDLHGRRASVGSAA